MDIQYKTTEHFEKNNLFNSDAQNGITIKKEDDTLLIKGEQRDLIELADILISLASTKENRAHIHIDDLTLLNNESDFTEVIIEKECNIDKGEN